MTTHRPGNCWQITTATHCWCHKTCRHSHFLPFSVFVCLSYDCPCQLIWPQLVGKQLGLKLKKEVLSLHHVASGCYPVVSLSILNFWDMPKFTLVSKTHKINQTDWIKFHLPPPAGWYNTVVSCLKPTLGYITSKDFPGVPKTHKKIPQMWDTWAESCFTSWINCSNCMFRHTHI